MASNTYDMKIYKGCDFDHPFLVKNSDNTLLSNLGLYTIQARMKRELSDISYISFSVTIDSENSIFTLSLNKTITANLTPGTYYYDVLFITTSNGFISPPVFSGIVNVCISPSV